MDREIKDGEIFGTSDVAPSGMETSSAQVSEVM
jgi:hypothetical protein